MCPEHDGLVFWGLQYERVLCQVLSLPMGGAAGERREIATVFPVPPLVDVGRTWGRCGGQILCENLTPNGVHCGTPMGLQWRGGGCGIGVCALILSPQRRVEVLLQ
jgi:hypothetical protein